MTDSPRRDGADPTQPLGPGYPGYTDPAYAGQAPYGPIYQPSAAPNPTEPLPGYSPYGYDPYSTNQYGGQYPPGEGQPSPEGPKAPRWLWIVAAAAVLTVVGLVIALVIVNSSQQQTVVAPLPSPTEPRFTTPTTTAPPTTTSRTPAVPVPSPPAKPPTESTVPGATETVVYDVTGGGRAINITYVDTGGVLQTEFNVILPWRKEVQVPQGSASISIINVGREVTCSITIDGVAAQQQTGAGLTICTAER